MENIRNFCIIAHIDHGKSTLADRFLELTGTINKRDMKHSQILDMMDLEQERGITIKLAPVRMEWAHQGKPYILNLIDTPGHVDFTYEVSRSLACCEGALLLVDATQGIQAQTLANAHFAEQHGLKIIPIINKIDLPAAAVEGVANEIKSTLKLHEEPIPISAKYGTNAEKVLEAIVKKIPPPKQFGGSEGETKALIFDSVYDSYKGVRAYVRLFSGDIKKGDKMYFLSTKKEFEVLEVGYFKPKYARCEFLHSGEIGYVVTGMKSVFDVRVGDTLWKKKNWPKLQNGVFGTPLPGYKKIKPYVFASLFCIEGDDYRLLRDALQKLSLNDASLSFEPETSDALGNGFRCGFLGLLHMDIVKERLEREYKLNLLITTPGVAYEVIKKDGSKIMVETPSHLPNPSQILEIHEPWMKLEIITPREHIGEIMKISQDKRAVSKDMHYFDGNRVLLVFEIPLASIIIDFYDILKSVSSGYASMNYEFLEYRKSELVKLDILIAGKRVDALSTIVHKNQAYYLGAFLAKKLKELISKHLFEIPIQAAIGSKIIARETIGALRKNVTAKLYGGDRTRKDKLLKKQKAGKKKMKMFGEVSVPQEAFLALLKR